MQHGLDFPLPDEIAVGNGTALFVCGWAFSPEARIAEVDVIVDGEAQPAMDHGMPRRDVMKALDEQPHSFPSGFWGLVRISPGPPRELVLELRATYASGERETVELGRVQARRDADQPLEWAGTGDGPLVAICMATHEPSMEMFRRQVDSIRAQTHANWVCVVSDDNSTPERFAAIEDELAGDPRFLVSRSPRKLGFYANFERALTLAPRTASHIAMADQDDAWYPEKVETLLGALGDAKLVYSDARIVRPDGELVASTYWQHRRNNHTDLLSLLCANAVTGAASLFDRDVLDHALPFPPGQFGHFHDHWVGLTALALGEIAYVDRPLYDYVQHGSAVLGHARANDMPTLRDRLAGIRRPPSERVRLWRQTFFVDGCRLLQFATVLLQRCGQRMTPEKRTTIGRFLAADRSPVALGRFAVRAAKELVGTGKPETLGAELGLMFGFGWRQLVVAAGRDREQPRRRLRLDAMPPVRLVEKPGRRGPDTPSARTVAEKIEPLELAIRDDAPPRVNVLIPTIDLDHFFGGYIGKVNIARRLAQRGARVRLVTVDPVPPLPSDWKRRLEAYSGLEGAFDDLEVEFGRETQGLEVSRDDRFVATTWWTAHIARHATRALGGGSEGFLYLIQEYEPFTFPMGTYAALASESYTFPHTALFSTELLREWFRLRGIGVFARPGGDEASASFQNAITAVPPPTAEELRERGTRKLLFYARPEPHAARNMFELGMLALGRAVESGAFGRGWELYGIGTVENRRRIPLGSGGVLELLPRTAQSDYAALLRDHDVGVALMYTPHPSLTPIEMASAGMLTVTTSFESKTPEAMRAISENILAVKPTIEGVALGIAEAVAGADDYDRRARGSAVAWSRDWATSLDDELMERVESLLRAPAP